MKCNVPNIANGKKSELYDQLKEIFQDEQAAEIAYSKIIGSFFMKRFGDWEYNYKNPNATNEEIYFHNNGITIEEALEVKGLSEEEVSKEIENLRKLGLTSKEGEPLLKQDLTVNMWFFTDKNGDRDYIDKYKFSEFTAQQVELVTQHLLFNFVSEGGKKSFNEYDPDVLEGERILESIDRAIENFKENVKGKDNEAVLLERIALVEKNKEDFRSEIISSIAKLGVKVKEKITDAEGNTITEVTEAEKGGGVNIKESYETNSLESATVNTKIMLSMLEERVFAKNENGDEVSLPAEDPFLEVPSFAKFDDVWSTLNTLLVDSVGYGHGENVIDIFDVMYNKIIQFQDTKPWMHDLLDTLNAYIADDNVNKITEFVQAFNKTNLNYFVTQVDGGDYTIINATSTNSRQSQITNRWNNAFIARFIDKNGNLADRERGILAQVLKDTKLGNTALNKNLTAINREYKAAIELAENIYEKDSEGRQDSIQKAEAKKLDDIYELGGKEAVNLVGILERLGATNITTEDVNTMILFNGGEKKIIQTLDDLYGAIRFMLGGKKGVLTPGFEFLDNKSGAFENVFNKESFTKAFAEAVGYRLTDKASLSVLLNQGKSGYTITNPTYISNKINEWKNDQSELHNMLMDKSKNNSQWLSHLLALDVTESRVERESTIQNRLDNFKAGLDASFKSKGKNDGVENTSITTNDQINANLVQMLNENLGGKSMFPTIIAADKSRRILFEGLPVFESGIRRLDNGETYISPKAVDVAFGYFLDEYNRMKRVNRENKDDYTRKAVHYHGTKDSEGNIIDGNGSESQIFPEFNKNSLDPKFQELRSAIYGKTFESDKYENMSRDQEAVVRKFIEADLKDRVNEHTNKLGKISNISEKQLAHYGNDMTALAGDYFMNGLISSVEYTKMFSGDPAYYKNNADLIKRIPATYTDGLQLRLESRDSLIFNQATINGVEVASQYVDKILSSVKDKSIANAYNKVNTTDAQAWITPRRWRFLKQKLGQWGPQHDKVWDKMKSGQSMSPQEMKLAAQPLKGVYFEINEGRPVYLKYSQAVLIPYLVKGTPMEAMYNKMTKNPETGKPYGEKEGHLEIHELVTIDGIKVGAIEPTSIHKEGTTEMLSEADINLNPVRLNNRGWKLQQDLPIKLMHDTNVGSQIQKNIFEGLQLTENYTLNGDLIEGKDLAQRIHDTVSKLSNLGKEDIKREFGIDENNIITDKKYIYNALLREFEDRGGNENVLDALRKQMPLDSIPQIKGKVESIFMSIMNRKMTKISTAGGSFIQVSPFGLETVGKRTTQVSPNVETVNRYSIEDVQSNPDKIYVFGDNSERSGTGGQAQIRNNPNAMGIATKISPNNKPEAFMTDKSLSENKKLISSDIQKILDTNKELVFPKDGFGTGLAKLKESAPKTYAYLKSELLDKFGFNNDTGVVNPITKTEDIESGITIVSKNYNGKGLLPPRIVEGKVLPGQAFITHTQAMELLKKHSIKLEGKTLASAIALLDPSALEMITYRIPNQGMSSNDYLEIVGVLPPGVGDSIIVYDGLPAKTGSDFDIDKLFAMQNTLVYDPEIMKLTKLTRENAHLLPKEVTKLSDNASAESKQKQILEDEANHASKIEKLLTQNDLVAQYKAVLNSPLTYDAMMRSIDGAQLKDDIVGIKGKDGKLEGGLFPAPVMKNMELFSPLTQLETKSEYLSGKMGVGQTANHLVDHVMNQMLNVRLNKWLGVGNQREVSGKKGKKTITFFDSATTGIHSIADNLSAFLNAYVDIAKDPYIARANHNSITANVTFMLLRAGADMKWVNRFIGQPILKELIALQQEQMSITANEIMVEGSDGKLSKGSALDQIRANYGFAPIPQNVNGSTVAALSEAELEENITGDTRNTKLDYEVLKAWTFLQEQGKLFGESVIAAKSDTAGAGGSNVDRLVNENKIEKIINRSGRYPNLKRNKSIQGYDAKFQGTMLATYAQNTLDFVRDVVRASDLFLSGTQGAIDTYNAVSFQTANGELLTDVKLGKSIDGAFYSYIMSGTTLFKNNNKDYDRLSNDIPQEIMDRKLAIEEGRAERNYLLEEFEISDWKNKKYIGMNNKEKPTDHQNQIYRSWMDLYNKQLYKEDGKLDTDNMHPDKKLAIDLVKYAFLSSGFQNNLTQFFTDIPHQILKEHDISGDIRDAISEADRMPTDSYFLEQLQRHSSENSKIVKSLDVKKMEVVNKNSNVFIYKPAKNKSQEFGTPDGKSRFFPRFVKSKSGNNLYEQIGTVKRKDAEGNDIKVPVYAMTFKLGSTKGKYKSFEYEKGSKITESQIPENNLSPKNQITIQDGIDSVMKSEETFKDNNGKEFDDIITDSIIEQRASDNQIIKDNLAQIIEDKKIKCK
jgi:hypothetical protein